MTSTQTTTAIPMAPTDTRQLTNQIKRLGDHIRDTEPGEPSQPQGAIDTAIRLLDSKNAEIAELRGKLDGANACWHRAQAELDTIHGDRP